MRTALPAFVTAVLLSALPWAAAQTPWPIGKIDARAIWTEPRGGDTSRCDSAGDALPRQLACILQMMRRARAASEAIAFTRWYAATSRDVGYLSKLRAYGPVSLATVELPLRRDTNAHTDRTFEIVNGIPNPVRGDVGCSDTDPSLHASRDFRRLKQHHPDLTTWEGTDFVNATMLPGGVQRFVFSCPLGEYHAAAGQWLAFFTLDFDAGGKFLGHRLLKISAAR